MAQPNYDSDWPLNFSSRGSDKVQLIVFTHYDACKKIIQILPPATVHSSLLTLISNVRSTSLLMPHSPLWQFSKSNANPVASLCKTAFHNIDCHSQLGERGKGLVFTSNLRLAQSAPKTQPGRIWSVSIISQQISQGWATYPNRKEKTFNNHSTDSPSI